MALLDTMKHINAGSEDDWTPLHLVVLLQKESVMRTLLNTNENEVNTEGKDDALIYS